MARVKNALEVELPDGRAVVVVELGLGEVKRAMQLASSEQCEDARRLETAVQGLRMSVQRINGATFKYDDLVGVRWEDQFSMSETMMLASIWNGMHMPDGKQLDVMRGNAKTIAL